MRDNVIPHLYMTVLDFGLWTGPYLQPLCSNHHRAWRLQQHDSDGVCSI